MILATSGRRIVAMATLREAQGDLARYEKLLQETAQRALEHAAEETDAPWVAVAIGYHHGLSFDPLLGVLPLNEYEVSKAAFDTPRDRFNPAEWTHWDDAVVLESDELVKLGSHLEGLGESADDEARHGREIHVRVATALRKSLLEAGLLTTNGLVFATEFSQADWEENVCASNPAEACAAHGV